jgi:chaperone BCS1
LPFDRELVSSRLDVDTATFLVIPPGTRCYQLVLGYVASSSALQSLEVDPGTNTLELRAGLGMHEIHWGGHQLHCLRQTAGDPVGTQCCAEQKELLVLFGEDEQQLRDFCSELIRMSEETREHTFTIFHWHVQNQYWQRNHCVKARPLESVVLPAATKNELLTDIADFDSGDTKEYYLRHGIPYKRSYLFYGLPGSGKTSLIQALAGYYSRNVCYIHPTHPLMTDDSLRAAINDAPPQSIIVLEDIDAMFGKNRESKVSKSCLTFSGLLNALDGIGNPQGQIFVLTTNFRESLDEALIRNGRVDIQIRFNHVEHEQMADMFRSFQPQAEDRAVEFAERLQECLGSRKISAAALQHFFVTHRRASVSQLMEDLFQVAQQHDNNQSRQCDEAKRAIASVESKL